MEPMQNNDTPLAEDLPEEEFDLPEEITAEPSAPIILPETDRQRGVEAMLFAAPEPMTPAQLSEQLQLTPEMVQVLLAELAEIYAPRGINLVERGGKWLFQTAPDLAPHMAFVRTRPAKLSRAAMETLAVIAYHQPVTRTEIENIRGVAIHKGTLDLLLETGWIKPGKRREIPGRPLTWVTTESFLQHFGLTSVKELPGVQEMKAAGLLDKRPAIALVPERDETPEAEAPAEAEDLSDFLPESTETQPA
jgi:segregation and condensation protein B